MEILSLLLLTITLSLIIAFVRVIITNFKTKTVEENGDLFIDYFVGGLFGGLLGSLLGLVIGYIIYLIIPDNDGGFIFPSNTYKFIGGYISFLLCWFIGVIVGSIKSTK